MRASTTPSAFHRALFGLVARLLYERVSVRQADRIAGAGPTLFLGLHRNGAVDGVIYLHVAPRAAYLLSAQLHRSALGRWLLPGIAVSRRKDRQRGIEAANEDAIDRCAAQLLAGGQVFVMPEGTSSLGPRHLPFKQGFAQIVQRVQRAGSAMRIVPLAIHYECAWEWQSRVEIDVGEPLEWGPGDDCEADAIMRRATAALEAVGVNVASEEELRFIEMLAYAATLGTDLSYGQCLKRFEGGVPPELLAATEDLQRRAACAGAWTHQGVPLVPIRGAWGYAVLWLLLAPVVAAFLLANAPPLLAGYVAGRVLPDDRNVIAFWRGVVGVPCAFAWLVCAGGLLVWLGGAALASAYLLLSVLGLRLVYRFRKLTVTLHNLIFAPGLRQPLVEFHRNLLTHFRP